MKLLDINHYIPLLYWTSKQHKCPYKFRFIAGASKCYNKQLAIELSLALKCIKNHFKNYCKVIQKRTCISYYWSIDNSHEFFTGGNRAMLPSSRWRRRGRSLRKVFACSCFFATTDISPIYNRETRRHGTPCTKTSDSYLFSLLYNNPRKIRRETTVGKFVPNNGRR